MLENYFNVKLNVLGNSQSSHLMQLDLVYKIVDFQMVQHFFPNSSTTIMRINEKKRLKKKDFDILTFSK